MSIIIFQSHKIFHSIFDTKLKLSTAWVPYFENTADSVTFSSSLWNHSTQFFRLQPEIAIFLQMNFFRILFFSFSTAWKGEKDVEKKCVLKWSSYCVMFICWNEMHVCNNVCINSNVLRYVCLCAGFSFISCFWILFIR